MKPYHAFILLLLLIVALVAMESLAGCASKNGGRGGDQPATKPSTPPVNPPPPAAQAAVSVGIWVGVGMIVAGMVLAAFAMIQSRPPMTGLAVAGAGAATWMALDFLTTFRTLILIGAGLALMGLLAWEILIHRKALQKKMGGDEPLPDLRLPPPKPKPLQPPPAASI